MRAQEYFRETTSESDGDAFSTLLDTVKLLRVLLEDVPQPDNYIDESVLYVMDVAAQAMNTLTDMTQVTQRNHILALFDCC